MFFSRIRRGWIIAGGFALLVLIGLVLWQFEFAFNDAKVQQALIAGGFLSAGWIVTLLGREIGLLVDRRENSVDLQLALRAEIYDYSIMLDDTDADTTVQDNVDYIRKRVLDAEDGKLPFIHSVSEAVIFKNLAEKMPILPPAVIDGVVQFYSVLSDVRLMVDDIRRDDFGKLDDKYQADAFERYLRLRATAVALANNALNCLNESLGVTDDPLPVGPEMSEDEEKQQLAQKAQLREWVNSQTSGRVAPQRPSASHDV